MDKKTYTFILKDDTMYAPCSSELETMNYYKNEVTFSKEDLTFCCAFLTLQESEKVNSLYKEAKCKEAFLYIQECSEVRIAE